MQPLAWPFLTLPAPSSTATNAFARTLGYTSLELKRSKLVDQRHPADHDTWRQATQRLLAGETAAAVIDTRYIAKDGSWVWTRESISLVRHPAAHMVIISEDRTLQRMAERALVQTEGLVALDGFLLPLRMS